MSHDAAPLQAAYLAALQHGDEAAARGVIADAQARGLSPTHIYYDIFAPSMIAIGELWERNEITVAEEHLATAVTERLIAQLSPLFERPADQGDPGTVLIGCVAGEQHALGAQMLADLCRAQGWRVLFLCADVPTGDWVRLAVRFNVELVAISAGMDRHLPTVAEVIRELRGAQPRISVLVGGAAFLRDHDRWREVGADVFHPDPQSAVTIATARFALGRDQARSETTHT
jgi:MerR family transcriptional regulator, light-induced transcriptional regulator